MTTLARAIVLGAAILGSSAGLGCDGDDDDDGSADASIAPDAPPAADAAPPDAAPPDAAPIPLTAPTDVVATPGAGVVTISWSNPSATAFAGVIVVRRAGSPVAAEPSAGFDYPSPGDLGPGQAIIYAGTGGMVVDSDGVPGPVHYAIYAKDTALAWSPPGRATTIAPVPPQLATLTVSLAGTPGVVVSSQPRYLTLGATLSYDDAGDTITVNLSTTSGFLRPLFTPKAVVLATNQGALATPDGQLGGRPFRRLGLGLQAGATSAATPLVFTGITGATDPITIELQLVDHPLLLAGAYFVDNTGMVAVDTGTHTAIGPVACDALAYTPPMGKTKKQRCMYRPGVMRADATRAYFGHRSLPAVRVVDPTTGGTIMSTNLAPGSVGSVDHVELDATGTTLYATVNLGGHAYPAKVPALTATALHQVILVKLDAATLAELGRVVLFSGAATNIRGKRVAISPDGTRAAVAMYNQDVVRMVDTATMAEIDTDLITMGTQGVAVPANGVKQVIWTADSDAIYAYFNTNQLITRINATTFVIESFDVNALGGGLLSLGPDGRLWVARGATDTVSTVRVFDPTTNTITTTVPTGALSASVIAVTRDGARAYAAGFQADGIMVIDAAAGVLIDADGDASNGDTAIVTGSKLGQHWLLLTPY